MTTHFFLAPNARWQGRNLTGEAVIGGKLYTYINDTTTPKATYQDFEGENPNTNPIILDGKGEANIYWSDDSYYRIDLYTADDQLVYSQSNYPYVTNNNASPSQEVANVRNIVRNQQFSFWSNGTSFPDISASENNYDYIADDWYFSKTDESSTVNISRQSFAPGDANEISYAPYYIEYYCADIGDGEETNAGIYQKYNSAGTFSGSTVSLTFTARVGSGFTSGTITPVFVQNFGTGGSPSTSVSNAAEVATLTSAWQTFARIVPIESILGKTLGTDGNDTLQLWFKAPSNVIIKFHIQSAQVTPTETAQPYQFESLNDQIMRLNTNLNRMFSTGDYKHSISTTNDDGWVLCSNQTIGSTSSGSGVAGTYTKALFKKLWSSALNLYCPIFNSDGTLGVRGSDAETDFYLDKRLSLTLTLGRVLAGANPTAQASFVKYFNAATDVNLAGDYIQLNDTSSLYNGTLIEFGSSGVLPTTTPQIVPNTDYFVINNGSNRIKLATTLANAVAGTPFITMDALGSGTVSLGVDSMSTPLCSFLGEDLHALINSELSAHSHPNTASSSTPTTTISPASLRAGLTAASGGGQAVIDNGVDGSPLNIIATTTAPIITMTNANTGGSALHNNDQPTLYTNIMLKL